MRPLCSLTGRSADDVVRANNLVLAVAWRATLAFSQRWNSLQGLQLPLEVHYEVFSYLEFNDCLAFSAVCKRWRTVALAEPRIWSTFTSDLTPRRMFKLEEMLRRSGTVPLSVELRFTNDKVWPMLQQHMWRMRSFTTEFTPKSTFLRHPAPILESLHLTFDQFCVTLPGDLFGEAQCLRTLTLCRFILPERCPTLRNLVSFSGIFDRAGQLHQLFKLCPRLVDLTVQCSNDHELALNSRPVLIPVPASVRSLRLSKFEFGALNYQDALQCYAGRTFEFLSISTCYPMPGPVELFARSHDRPWSMQLDISHTVKMRTCNALDELATHVSVEDPISAAFFHGLHPSWLGNLVSLSVTERQLHIFRSSSVTLPGLRSLSIALPDELSKDRLSRGSLVVPALEYLTVNALPVRKGHNVAAGPPKRHIVSAGPVTPTLSPAMLSWFFGLLPKHLRSWLWYDAASLTRIELAGTVKAGLEHCLLPANISAFANELILPVVESSTT